ncbi:uncharacterized protein C11orf42 homolog isoform X1 [Tupaia chinensis]|uniref:uncharacterized protein C11orf42 homolog isoform X1 n=1 Tax=Tupaia chinensis TaxID=246437 RepID=UPI0003C8F973|nr:uncharacterized protein C11orf42 homolog isoform X1 [Tupaia chinensis]
MLVGTPHLLTVDEADATWTLIKDKVIEERFGSNVVAVPFLSDAACYDLLGVLVKQSRPAHTRLALPGRQGRRALKPVGPLPNLLEQAGSEGAFAHCTREYSPNGRAEIAYEEMRLLDGQPCRIRLHMGGLRKKVAFLLLPPGQVSLQQTLPWLRSTHSIYVIYQVFSCSWLQLGLLPTGREPQLLRLQRSLPVAFSCLKFSLQPKGVLGPQKPLTKDPLPHGANWVRPNLSLMPPLAPTSVPADAPEAVDVPPTVPAPPTPPPQEGPEGRPTRFSYKGRNPFRRGPQMLSGSVLGVRQRRLKLRQEMQGARPPRSGIGILVPNKHQLLLPQTILGPCCFFLLGSRDKGESPPFSHHFPWASSPLILSGHKRYLENLASMSSERKYP